MRGPVGPTRPTGSLCIKNYWQQRSFVLFGNIPFPYPRCWLLLKMGKCCCKMYQFIPNDNISNKSGQMFKAQEIYNKIERFSFSVHAALYPYLKLSRYN